MARQVRNRSGSRIRQARELRGLTQEQVAAQFCIKAAEAGVAWNPTRDVIQSVEDGTKRVTDEMLLVVALTLRTDPTWLIGHPDGVEPKELRRKR